MLFLMLKGIKITKECGAHDPVPVYSFCYKYVCPSRFIYFKENMKQKGGEIEIANSDLFPRSLGLV